MNTSLSTDEIRNYLNWAKGHIFEIPEGKTGSVEINHRHIKSGEKVPLISYRNAILMGLQPLEMIIKEPYTEMFLNQEGAGLWMSSSFQEILQTKEPIASMSDHALIGGLGLGIFPTLYIQSGRPWQNNRMTIIEQSEDIIKAVEPHLPFTPRHPLIEEDLYKFIKDNKGKVDFDCAFFDIWQPTGESVWFEHIVPLRRLCRGWIPQSRIFCWLEEEVIGQIFSYDIAKVGMMDPSFFRKGAYPKHVILNTIARRLELPVLIKDKKALRIEWDTKEQTVTFNQAIDRFTRTVGTDRWEEEFGDIYDEAVGDYKKACGEEK